MGAALSAARSDMLECARKKPVHVQVLDDNDAFARYANMRMAERREHMMNTSKAQWEWYDTKMQILVRSCVALIAHCILFSVIRAANNPKIFAAWMKGQAELAASLHGCPVEVEIPDRQMNMVCEGGPAPADPTPIVARGNQRKPRFASDCPHSARMIVVCLLCGAPRVEAVHIQW